MQGAYEALGEFHRALASSISPAVGQDNVNFACTAPAYNHLGRFRDALADNRWELEGLSSRAPGFSIVCDSGRSRSASNLPRRAACSSRRISIWRNTQKIDASTRLLRDRPTPPLPTVTSAAATLLPERRRRRHPDGSGRVRAGVHRYCFALARCATRSGGAS